MKSAVARRAVEAGASVVNDVTGGLAEPGMAEVISGLAVPIVVGHIQGTPRTMQISPSYEDPVDETRTQSTGRGSSGRNENPVDWALIQSMRRGSRGVPMDF